jgi:glycosyltransferase involved in cell wall biosynthesis
MNFETGMINTDIVKGEKEVLPQAQHVFFTSQPLAYRKSSYAKSWSMVGNGVNYDIFSKYREKEELVSTKRNSVGYLGNLSDFFNWELMCDVAEQMPEVDFIFYGQLEIEKMKNRRVYADRLMAYNNTIFTGRVTREEGAVGINLVDILIIPFVINDAMHAVNPLKLWEYFATGKPVVSTPMDAVKIDKSLLRVASSTIEWIKAIEESILENNIVVRNKRIKLAKDNSWDTLTIEHSKVINVIFDYLKRIK